MTTQPDTHDVRKDAQKSIETQINASDTRSTSHESALDENTSASQHTEEEIITPAILNLDYRYVRLLGEGANGRTWLAKDRRNATNVAIKELKFTDDIKCFELFEREAEVLQSVNIDGVPRFIGHYAQGGTNYIIQEYIPYPSLDMLLERGEIFSEEEVYTIIELLSRILFALQTQYDPPIIHRDIKPGNILYKRREGGRAAQIWLIDFGAVANPQKQSSGSTIAGTFGYMAPEQLQGEVSTRSDFYALGSTALHLLTGVFPYEIPNELFKLKFHPVIAEKAPKTTKPMIHLLDRLLASNAENRPANVHELRQAIQEARQASNKYREIDDPYETLPEFAPKTKLGKWFKKTRLARWIHARRVAVYQFKKRIRRFVQLKKLAHAEKIERIKREKEAKRLKAERESNGIFCECTAKRVSVDYAFIPIFRRESILLEGLFSYQGNWYSAFVHSNHKNIDFECLPDDYDDKKIKANTFKVLFVPNTLDITIPRQTIQLTRDLYTRLTGKTKHGSANPYISSKAHIETQYQNGE